MRIFRIRSTVAVLSAAVLAIGLAGCGAGDEKNDKEITVYSGRAKGLVQPVIDKFSKATGITVNVRYGETAAMASQLLEEGDKTTADVFLAQDAGALGAVAGKGLFVKLPDKVTGLVPEQYRSSEGKWVGVTGRARVLVYDSQTFKPADLPKSVYDLTGASWKGKVGIAPTNGSFQAFVTGMRVKDGDNRARDFLRSLKANDVQIRENNVTIVSEVDKGKLPAGLVNHYYLFEQAHEAGKSVDAMRAKLHFFTGGDPGGLVNVSGVGITKRAEGDQDTATFVEYLLGKDGQTYFAEELFEYPLVDAVKPAEGLPALSELETPKIDLEDLESLDVTLKMITDAGLA
ncbi:MAG: iron ABC transporter substrate-binding protein [Micromonosporaceae bacterium]